MPAYSAHKCPQWNMLCIVEYNQSINQYGSKEKKHFKYGSIENCVKIYKEGPACKPHSFSEQIKNLWEFINRNRTAHGASLVGVLYISWYLQSRRKKNKSDK